MPRLALRGHGRLHQHLRSLRLPRPVDDGDRRARADDGRRGRRLGIDPLEFRRRNVIQRGELPYTTADRAGLRVGQPGRDPRAGRRAASTTTASAPQQATGPGRRPATRHRPVGSTSSRSSAFGILATEAATIRIEPSGKVNVLMGTGSHGQSLETTIVQVVADELGVDIDDVRLVQGDTAATPYGPVPAAAGGAAIASGAAIAGRRSRPGAKVLRSPPTCSRPRPTTSSSSTAWCRSRACPTPACRSPTIARASRTSNTDALPPGRRAGSRGVRRGTRRRWSCSRTRPTRSPSRSTRHTGAVHDPAVRRQRGLRQHDQPDGRRGADRRRRGAGHRRRASTSTSSVRRRRQSADDHVPRLPPAHRGRGARPRVRPRRDAVEHARAATRAWARAARSPHRRR